MDNDVDARETILDFLEWSETDEESFAQDVRIILVSADFGIELTTSVMWLNERDIDIRCIRIMPYKDNDRTLIDVQQIIPLPEAAEYQVQIREKQKKERGARKSDRDYTRYDVTIEGETHSNLFKCHTMFLIVKYLCDTGVTPEEIMEASGVKFKLFFRSTEGEVSSEELIAELTEERKSGGRSFDPRSYFCEDDELIYCNGKTYTVTNQWGTRTIGMIKNIILAFPDKKITCRPAE